MKFYVGITDQDWIESMCKNHASEANMWRTHAYEKDLDELQPGEIILFKQSKPQGDCIVGGGTFVHSTKMSLIEAWLAFQTGNGVNSLEELCERATEFRLRRNLPTSYSDEIHCNILASVFFLEAPDYILKPNDWENKFVAGKLYDWQSQFGLKIRSIISKYVDIDDVLPTEDRIRDEKSAFGSSYLVRGRLGQGALRILSFENFSKQCCISGETLNEVLECAHLRALKHNGRHDISNVVPLRSDLHKLYDLGLISFDDSHNVILSDLIPMDSVYRAFEGKSMANSKHPIDPESVRWHRETVFRLNSSE